MQIYRFRIFTILHMVILLIVNNIFIIYIEESIDNTPHGIYYITIETN
jgi:hypothetical protein